MIITGSIFRASRTILYAGMLIKSLRLVKRWPKRDYKDKSPSNTILACAICELALYAWRQKTWILFQNRNINSQTIQLITLNQVRLYQQHHAPVIFTPTPHETLQHTSKYYTAKPLLRLDFAVPFKIPNPFNTRGSSYAQLWFNEP